MDFVNNVFVSVAIGDHHIVGEDPFAIIDIGRLHRSHDCLLPIGANDLFLNRGRSSLFRRLL